MKRVIKPDWGWGLHLGADTTANNSCPICLVEFGLSRESSTRLSLETTLIDHNDIGTLMRMQHCASEVNPCTRRALETALGIDCYCSVETAGLFSVRVRSKKCCNFCFSGTLQRNCLPDVWRGQWVFPLFGFFILCSFKSWNVFIVSQTENVSNFTGQLPIGLARFSSAKRCDNDNDVQNSVKFFFFFFRLRWHTSLENNSVADWLCLVNWNLGNLSTCSCMFSFVFQNQTFSICQWDKIPNLTLAPFFYTHITDMKIVSLCWARQQWSAAKTPAFFRQLVREDNYLLGDRNTKKYHEFSYL